MEDKKDETKTEEKKPEEKKEVKKKSSELVEEANAAADRLEEANKTKAELLDREERLRVQEQLSGKSEAGAAPIEKPKETPADYAKRVMRGELNK